MISIIIINYNTFQLTCTCIRSIYTHCPGEKLEIILVDNASTEYDPELFLQEFPEIKLIRNRENNGFAKGNNLGIRASMGTYILLLNSDTWFTHNPFPEIRTAFEGDTRLGAAGIRMIYPDGDVQHTARKFRSIWWEWLDLLRFLPALLPYRKRAALMLGRYFKNDYDLAPDWLNGAFLMFSAQAIKELGGQLDERWFMYGEDQLWCWQLKQKGFHLRFLHRPHIVHINSGSSSPEKRLKLLKLLMKRELELMEIYKGRGLYYYAFALVFLLKDYGRYLIKKAVFRATGKLLR